MACRPARRTDDRQPTDRGTPDHPGDLRVVVNGYEEGYDDLTPDQISIVRIALNTGADYWVGQHGRPTMFPPVQKRPRPPSPTRSFCAGLRTDAASH